MSTTVLQKNGNIHIPKKQVKALGLVEGDELICRTNEKTGELKVTKLNK